MENNSNSKQNKHKKKNQKEDETKTDVKFFFVFYQIIIPKFLYRLLINDITKSTNSLSAK